MWTARAPLADHPHGALRAVDIEGDASMDALARLLPEERAFAEALAPLRARTWIAGRIALAEALAAVGAPREALLATARGAPLVPRGFVGSVSHKATIAIAIAARDEGAGLGVDVEELATRGIDIARKVLTDREMAALAEGDRAWGTLARFSIKEAIYKAVDPFVRRYVAFKEAEVDLGPRGGDGVQRAAARLDVAEGAFAVEATWCELGGHLITSARVRPVSAPADTV